MSETDEKVTSHIKPEWLKIRISSTPDFARLAKLVEENGLHTICSSGKCPNQAECWNRRTATFMILGDICTRSCRFCATKTGKTLPIDQDEPERIAGSIHIMGLKHAVITSVTRDYLPDEGAAHWAAVVNAVRELNPDTTIELLIPDMHSRADLLDIILSATPDIVGHNIETVQRLTPLIRSKATYRRSLDTISYIHSKGSITKSGLMLGMGETEEEVLQALNDLRSHGCDIITMGQYLRPTRRHWEVADYISPGKFEWYGERAREMGFSYVASAPLVRSSYLADKALEFCNIKFRNK